MKPFSRLNHYEVLEVGYDASNFEIKQAYKRLVEIYAPDSLATYALFSSEERKVLLDRIEAAFQTLSNERRRAAYNRELAAKGEIDPACLPAEEKRGRAPVEAAAAHARRLQQRHASPEAAKIIAGINDGASISGAELKRLRQALGLVRQEIFQLTKISPTVIEALEADDYENLPPGIYLKGFLRAYADALGLDAKKVVAGYLAQMARHL